MRIDRRSLMAGALAAPAILGALRAAVAADPPWMILSGDQGGPDGRWGHALISDAQNGRLLVIGGRDSAGVVRGDLWSFDLASSAWSELDLSGPRARSGSAAAVASDSSGFYYFGGESGDATFGDLWWFDFARSSWSQVESQPGPAPRFGTSGDIDAFGRFVISHGGDRNGLFDDTWAYDPAARTWSDISPAVDARPLARTDHTLLSVPDYGLLLLYGGCSDGIGPCPHGDLWSLDVSSGIWTEITPFEGPSPRSRTTMARLGNVILLVGGLSELGPMSDVWTGDLQTGAFVWAELTAFNHGPQGIYRRAGHAMTAAGNEFYVFGGEGVEGPLSDLWKFSLDRMAHPGEEGERIEPQ